jgi:flagellar FliL protein
VADDKAAEPVEAAPAAGVSPTMLMGILGLNLVVMIAVVAVLFIGQKKKEGTQSIEQVASGASEKSGGHGAPAAPGSGEHGGAKGGEMLPGASKSDIRFFSAGDFTANLSGPTSTHYVKVNVNLEMGKELDEEEMKKRKPQIRDRIISLLNGKKPVELQSVDGRDFLKEEIKTVVNGFLQSGKIEGVYFSTFIVN